MRATSRKSLKTVWQLSSQTPAPSFYFFATAAAAASSTSFESLFLCLRIMRPLIEIALPMHFTILAQIFELFSAQKCKYEADRKKCFQLTLLNCAIVWLQFLRLPILNGAVKKWNTKINSRGKTESLCVSSSS